MERTATAVWEGGLKDGQGSISTESRVLDGVNYSFSKRFGYDPGTNPEELIGAAHAGCFSMALSGKLGAAGLRPERITTDATVYLEKIGEGFEVTRVHLATTAVVPNATEEQFQEAANNAKTGCPISKLLRTAEITLDARLEQAVAT